MPRTQIVARKSREGSKSIRETAQNRIREKMRLLGLEQQHLAQEVGVRQGMISHMLNYPVSFELLFDYLNRLGDDVKIVVRPAKRRKSAKTTIEIAHDA